MSPTTPVVPPIGGDPQAITAALEEVARRAFGAPDIRFARFLKSASRKYEHGVIEGADLIQDIYFTILKSALFFDEQRSADPSHYLLRAIGNRARTLKRLEHQHWHGRQLEADAEEADDEDAGRGFRLEDVPDADQASPEEAAACHQVASCVDAWAASLPPRLDQLFDLLYRRGLTQREAATVMKLSRARIAQLHLKLLKRGKNALAHLHN